MNRERLDRLVEDTKSCAEGFMLHGSKVPIFLLICRRNDPAETYRIDIGEFVSLSHKEAAQEALANFFKRMDVIGYTVAMESWYGTNPNVRPSEDPNSKEALVICGADNEGNRRCYVGLIETSEGARSLKDHTHELDTIEGAWFHLLGTRQDRDNAVSMIRMPRPNERPN